MKKFLSLLISPVFLVSCNEEVQTAPVTPPVEEVATAQKTERAPTSDNTPAPQDKSSSDAYSKILDGNLLTLNGDNLVSLIGFQKPAKYYLFYKTASWCPPCQRFTPGLVKFYNDHKAIYGNDFELVLISSDRSLDDMVGYAVSKKMGWPHLAPEKVAEFSKTFPFPGRGIPNTILTDTEGNIIETSYDDAGKMKGPHVPVLKLQSLLASQ